MRGDSDDPLGTLTHARLRLDQGDPAGARRIVESILSRSPGDRRARGMLADLDGAPERPHGEPDVASAEPPTSARREDLAGIFRSILAPSRSRESAGRLERLEAWASRVRRNRG